MLPCFKANKHYFRTIFSKKARHRLKPVARLVLYAKFIEVVVLFFFKKTKEFLEQGNFTRSPYTCKFTLNKLLTKGANPRFSCSL